jgi:hypothetical protein
MEIKIRCKTSFGEKVKPSVPSRKFQGKRLFYSTHVMIHRTLTPPSSGFQQTLSLTSLVYTQTQKHRNI